MVENSCHRENFTPSYPRLFCLNSGNENALYHSDKVSFTHSKLVQQMRCDLSMLLAWVAPNPESDWVWMPQGASKELPYYGDLLPPCRCLFEDEAPYKLVTEPLELHLWAPESTLIRFFARKASLFPNGLLLPEDIIYPSCLFDRTQASLLLHSMSSEYAHLVPIICSSYAEIEEAITSFGTSSHIVVKLPYTSSGRGVQLFQFPLSEQSRKQLCLLLNTHKQLTIEPFLNKSADYAIEYVVGEAGRVSFVGLSHFETKKFRYLYNHLEHPDILWRDLSERIGESRLQEVIVAHQDFIQKHIAPYYQGPVGVDMLLYRVGDGGKELLHPSVEINVRSTMGLLAHLLYERYGEQGCSYKMVIQSYSQPSLALREYEAISRSYPPKSNAKGALIGGILLLTRPTLESRFLAYLQTL